MGDVALSEVYIKTKLLQQKYYIKLTGTVEVTENTFRLSASSRYLYFNDFGDNNPENRKGSIHRISEDGQVVVLKNNLKVPRGLWVSPDDRFIYFTQIEDRNIYCLSLDTQRVRVFNRDYSSRTIHSIKLNNDIVYAADRRNRMLQMFASTGKLINEISTLQVGIIPLDIDFVDDGIVLVVGERLGPQHFSGTTIAVWDGFKNQLWPINTPAFARIRLFTSIARDQYNSFYLSDRINLWKVDGNLNVIFMLDLVKYAERKRILHSVEGKYGNLFFDIKINMAKHEMYVLERSNYQKMFFFEYGSGGVEGR